MGVRAGCVRRVCARAVVCVRTPGSVSHTHTCGWQLRPDAPDTLDALYAKDPAVKEFVADLEKRLEPLGPRYAFVPDKAFLLRFGEWASLRGSPYARMLDLKGMNDDIVTLLGVFDATFGAERNAKPAAELVTFLRKRVLLDAYNMDPALMAEYTRDMGPLDWRHPAAHALYWARRGGQFGEGRINDDTIFKSLNNDRTEIQAMQALARSGVVSYDPFSGDNVTRLNDPRWIRVIDRYFERL